MRTRTTALAIAAVLVQALGSVTPAQAADPVTVTFDHTGEEQLFEVPAGVSGIHVVLVGGRGGPGYPGTAAGGAGARVEGILAVVPGSSLFIEVGGNGSLGSDIAGGSDAFNGGGAGGSGFDGGAGGGGGASDIRTVGAATSGSLASRLLVAAGGGGGGGSLSGGSGGAAGAPGSASAAATGGEPGSQSSGGVAGTPNGGSNAGALGSGGPGTSFCNSEVCGGGAGGGGGGGGYHGGGGGGGSFGGGGGGGGGSSFTGAATSATVGLDATGTPSITITYTPGSVGGGTVVAIVTMASSAVCLELSTSSIDFGTRRFGEVGAPSTPLIGVTNCSGIGEVILVRGTDATGPNASGWSLVDFGACQTAVLGTDKYRLRLESQAVPDVFVNLSTENDTLNALSAGSTIQHEAQIDTPCPGSTGAGEVMSMQILFTAIEEALP